MALFRMPPQILRLVILAGGIVGTYAVARVVLTPASFGQYGHYRGASLEENASRSPTFAGAKACDECHDDVVEKVAGFDHKTLACESCHGPMLKHVDDPEVTPAKMPDATCLRCHRSEPARPAFIKQISVTDHFAGDRCVECHIPHQPKESP